MPGCEFGLLQLSPCKTWQTGVGVIPRRGLESEGGSSVPAHQVASSWGIGRLSLISLLSDPRPAHRCCITCLRGGWVGGQTNGRLRENNKQRASWQPSWREASSSFLALGPT